MATQGLNDDVDDGLDLSSEVADLNPNQPIPDKVIFKMDISSEVDQDTVTPEDLFGVGVVKNEVPNLNAEFQLVTEKINKLTDLVQVYEDISKSNGICKEDAELVDSLAPGFINDKKPLGFFTDDKSRTQLTETLNTINKTIDTQTADIVIQASDIALKSCKALSTCFTDIETKIVSKLSVLQEQLGKLPIFLSTHPVESYHTTAVLRAFDLNIGVCFNEEELEKSYFDKFPNFIDSFEKANDFVRHSGKNKTNVRALLAYGVTPELFQTDNVAAIHQLAHGTYSTLSVNGDLDHLSTEESNKFDFYSYKYYHLVSIGASHVARDYLMLLVKASMQSYELIKERSTSIDKLNKADTNNYQAKLSTIFELHSFNTIDTVNAVALMSFVQGYCDYIEKIASALKLLLPDNELPA